MNGKSKGTVVFFTALITIAVFMSQYGNYQLAAIPSRIYEAYGLNDAQFSSIMTGPFLPAVLFSILFGVLADRIGLAKIVGICGCISLVGFIGRVYVKSYTGMLLMMALTGVVGTCLNANLGKLASSFYSKDKVGTIVGLFMAGSTGSMAVAYGTTAMIPTIPMVFWASAILCLVITAVWILTARQKYFQQDEDRSGSVPVSEALRTSVKSANVWLLGLSLMFLMAGATVITNFHVGALCAIRGYDEVEAGSYATVLMIGSLLGSLFVPIISAKLGRKAGPFILIITLIAAFCAVGIVAIPSSAGIYIVSFLNGALRSGTIGVCLGLPVMFSEIGPRYAGTAGGLAVTLELLGAVVIPTYIVVPLAGAGNFSGYFLWAGVLILISALLAFFVIQKSGAFRNL